MDLYSIKCRKNPVSVQTNLGNMSFCLSFCRNVCHFVCFLFLVRKLNIRYQTATICLTKI